MARKISLGLIFVMLLCLPLQGCLFEFNNISELARPPEPYGGNKQLKSAFESAVGSNVIYKSPVSGNYLSAYVVEDIDGDGDDEAVVFYAVDSVDVNVNMSIFDYVDGEWKFLLTNEGAGCDVYSVDFLDMNGDGVSEMIVGWSLFDSKSNKVLSVYEPASDGMLKELSTEMFTRKALVDIDSDGKEEIFLVCLDTATEQPVSTAKLLKMKDNSITIVDKKSLDGNVSSYMPIKTDTSGDVKIYIDATKSETQMITEVITWNSEANAMSVPLLDKEKLSNTASWRSVRLSCADINNDGIIEIPTQIALTGGETLYSGAQTTTPFYMTNWCALSGIELVPVVKSLVMYANSCMFKIPSEWDGKFTVESYSETNKWDFYSLNTVTQKKDEYLFSLIFTTLEDWKTNGGELYESYSLLADSDGKAVLVSGFSHQDVFDINIELLKQCVTYF